MILFFKTCGLVCISKSNFRTTGCSHGAKALNTSGSSDEVLELPSDVESEPVNAAEGGSEDDLELPEDVHDIPALFLGVSHEHCCF